MQDNAVHAVAVLYAALGREASSLRLHHEDPATTHRHCPGKNDVKADVVKRIGDVMAAMQPRGHGLGLLIAA